MLKPPVIAGVPARVAGHMHETNFRRSRSDDRVTSLACVPTRARILRLVTPIRGDTLC